jgi:hypothetical protein
VRRQRNFIGFTLLISILLGILFPLVLGVKDPTMIAITFSMVWFLYALIIFVTVFLIKPGLKIKVLHRKNPAIVRFDLTDSGEERVRESEKIQYPIKSEKKSSIIYN